MNRFVIERPNPKQDLAFRDKHRHSAYGGARGGGKSWFVRRKAELLSFKWAGIRVLIVRRTYPELEENHIIPMRKELLGFATYNKSEKRFTFPNGSSIKFMYCRYDADLDNFQGAEYDVIFIDEATQFTEYQLKCIIACNRGTNKFPKRVYYTCNPGGQGHGYIKRLFIDQNFQDGECPDDYNFIQALVQENKALLESDPDYIRNLEALPPKLRKAWLDGDWNVFEGQFFEDFINDPNHYEDRQWTHVISAFDIPRDWKIYRSYDFGYGKPFSCGWWAIDYDGIAYRILELYGCTGIPNEGVKWNPDKQFKEIKRVEEEHPWLRGKRIVGVADPSIWDASRGTSIEEVSAKNKIYWEPGDNKRIPGWMQMHYRLAFDDQGYPMMYIFENCKAFIRTIPLMMYDETNVEDLDTDLEDHVADESRYFCMSRPIKPRKTESKLKVGDDPLNMNVPKKKRYF